VEKLCIIRGMNQETSIPYEVLGETLNPVIDDLYQRHLRNAHVWFPHEFIPWSEGENYKPGEIWTPDHYPLPEGVRSALKVNLWTEDNLPYYFDTIDDMLKAEAWQVWAKHWTAEEMRHAYVMRSYMEIKRPVDPIELEVVRMAQVSKGEVPHPPNPYEGVAYVSFQELATRVAHSNTGRYLDDSGKKIMARVAADENLHHVFYRDLAKSMIEIDPSAMVIAIGKQLRGFAMPGTGIPDFKAHSDAISKAGIYDIAKFKENVVDPTLKFWNLEDLEDLTDEAKVARDGIDRTLTVMATAIRRLNRSRERAQVNA